MKLGGSVITDKSSYATPRLDNLVRLAEEIAAAGERVLVVHGAGSYGHVLAKEHALARGDDGDAKRRAAFGRVLADVRELQGLVVRALCDAGIPAVPHATFDLARLTAGELSNFSHAGLHDALATGFTPVISGDGALDAARGYGILSGDVLMAELARALRPSRAIFVTDVDGIFDKDPAEPGARLLPRIDLRTDVRTTESRVPDITGSMMGKLKRAREVARAGVPVHVVNGTVPGRLAATLAGAAAVGSIVTA